MKLTPQLVSAIPAHVKKELSDQVAAELEKVRDRLCAMSGPEETNVLRGRASTLSILLDSLKK